MAILASVPLLLHTLLLLPPSFKFLLDPPPSPPAVRPLVRSYAFLLLSTHLACLVLTFSLRPGSVILARLAIALAVYHFGPIGRAWGRLKNGELTGEMGGPGVDQKSV
ncbi:hypothetical protein [Phaffia rhodozyma]|uniref:Uncharacterized protein n=1 Tax=Phaffia rhodozyma TaxID=264483 RepID=A0A0F7SNX9_PHARH|nr:hypothetical protein [Phaffia rhodozyma]